MMKKYLLLLPILFLTACNTNRVKGIVSFTNELRADAQGVQISIPEKQRLYDWDEKSSSDINIDTQNGPLLNLSSKVTFHTLTLRSNIVTKPIIIQDKIVVLCADGSVAALM